MKSALQFLRGVIAETSQSPQNRLPSLAALAHRSGLPYRKLYEAVSQLKRTGELVVKPRNGMFLPRPSPPATRKPRPSSRRHAKHDRVYETVARTIRLDVQTVHTPLPSLKELSAHYDVKSDTMRKVLRRLARDGWVCQRGRRWYVVPKNRAARAGNRVLLIGQGLAHGVASSIPPRSRELIGFLNSECSRRALLLHLHGADEILHMSDRELRRVAGDSLGVIIWLFALPDGFVWADIVRRCLRCQPHTTVLDDENGRLPHPGHAVRGFPAARFYSAAYAEQDGHAVGVHVARHGHKEALFLTAEPLSTWSTARYRGICRAFEECGIPDGVHAVQIGRGGMLQDGSGFRLRMNQAAQGIVADLAQLLPGEDSRPPEIYRMEAVSGLRNYLRQGMIRNELKPVFERAVRKTSCSAWICANDEIALYALEYLRERGYRIPRDKAIAGFDDSLTSLYHCFDSYNFNMQGLASDMIDGIVHTRPRSELGVVLRVEGFITERGTVC